MTPWGESIARLLALLRLAFVPLVLVLTIARGDELPGGDEALAWAAVGVLAVGASALLLLQRRNLGPAWPRRLLAAGVVFDLFVAFALVLLFSSQPVQPLRSAFFLVVVEAAMAFGLAGGLVASAAGTLALLVAELFRHARFEVALQPEEVIVHGGLLVLIGVGVGRLVEALAAEHCAAVRATESERLQDEVGRRFDALEAANRCARALGSSLGADRAFAAFVRELRGVVPFDRLLVLQLDDGSARVVASAGRGAERYPAGSSAEQLAGALGELTDGRTRYRTDLAEDTREYERELLELGLRSRVVVPLQVGARTTGLFSVARRDTHAFAPTEVELLGLLGRVIASTVQNIHAFESERGTVEELRRLSALRADFVSLVSHELRSPMAAVVGAARTLESRWRELSPEQRGAFVSLIAEETSRLAGLVTDVLDTSRIDAGTFSYAFGPIDLGALVRDVVGASVLAQEDVRVVAAVREPLPGVHGDAGRLRQVVTNLVENAVKYSPAGGEVRVTAYARDGAVRVEVEDDGPGIEPADHALIFEKFGRATRTGPVRPGSGLGLFIARSIAEAHGGSLAVRSAPGRGSTFTLTVPAHAAAGTSPQVG